MGARGDRWSLDVRAMADLYERRGISKATFYDGMEDTLRVRGLEIEGFDWQILDHMLSSVHSIPITVHFEALAAGMGVPFEGIEPLFRLFVARGLMTEQELTPSQLGERPKGFFTFPDLLVAVGLCTADEVKAARRIRNRVEDELGLALAIGPILRSVAGLTIPDFVQALAMYYGVEDDTLDGAAAKIHDACCVRVTGTMRTLGSR